MRATLVFNGLIAVTGIFNYTLKSGNVLDTEGASAIYDCDFDYLPYINLYESYAWFSNCLNHFNWWSKAPSKSWLLVKMQTVCGGTYTKTLPHVFFSTLFWTFQNFYFSKGNFANGLESTFKNLWKSCCGRANFQKFFP